MLTITYADIAAPSRRMMAGSFSFEVSRPLELPLRFVPAPGDRRAEEIDAAKPSIDAVDLDPVHLALQDRVPGVRQPHAAPPEALLVLRAPRRPQRAAGERNDGGLPRRPESLDVRGEHDVAEEGV